MTRQNLLVGLIVGFLALIIIAAALVSLFPSGETKSASGETGPASVAFSQDDMKALAVDIAARIDGDAMAALQPGDENTTAFIAIREQLDAVRASNPNIVYIGTMRKTANATEYVVDTNYGSNSYATAIGDVYVPTENDTVFLAGFVEPSAETYTGISGYAPVRNSSGTVVGLVGIDTWSAVAPANMKALAADTAARIDGDAMAALQPGDENTTAFIAIRDQLDAVRASNNTITYAYTMRKAGDAVEYVVDVEYGSSKYAAAIGDPYAQSAADAVILTGFVKPCAGTYTDTVAYAPIKNSSGAFVGLVGVDAMVAAMQDV
ncbi:MAG: hypothetical protein PHP59_05125 [Methanofollis sp.]|uniref:hypothetical protein n=1 Tax=Methanofollis sp. TaxID=2052835 RepID=UPI002617E4EB|nr:hypothetical protein [Methanofollis sp.]MDD4254742.1 hypothetical protein [Methanofollis sp.]